MVDLAAERAALADSLERFDVFEVLRAETLPALEDSSQIVCLYEAEAADAMVLVIGDRYGYVPPDNNPEGLSVTHLEYRQARAAHRPVFVFVRSSDTREIATTGFVEEVGSFTRGAFWKEWETTATLVNEVERALINWLARCARSGLGPKMAAEMEETVRHVATALAPLWVSFAETEKHDGSAYAAWKQTCITTLESFARRQVLPIRIAAGDGFDPREDALFLVATPNDSGSVDCRIVPPPTADGALPGLPIVIDVPASNRAAIAIAHIVAMFGLFNADDVAHGLELSLALLEHPDLDKDARTELLIQMAFASVLEEGARASDIARAAIHQSLDDGPVTTAVTMALVQERARYGRNGARHAAEVSRSVAVELLIRALTAGRLAPDVLYNLARQFVDSPYARRFYDVLLAMHPEYEERWYVHRDIGLTFYHASDFAAAALAYERAATLKRDDAELFRWAGDALFYSGQWARSHPLFQRALSMDDTEMYFVVDKIRFVVERLRAGVAEEKYVGVRMQVNRWVTALHNRASQWGLMLPSWIYERALSAWSLTPSASTELALRSNSVGRYAAAVTYLRLELATVPENWSARLNLVANLIFLADGALTDEAKEHLRVAIFHGGPQTEQHFLSRLVNTSTAEEIAAMFHPILESARKAFEVRRERRSMVRKPEYFGTTLHVELSD